MQLRRLVWIWWVAKLVLFDLILYIPSAIFQLNRNGSSWVEPVLSWDICVLLKDHNAVTPVRLEPATLQSWVKHSTTEPLRSRRKTCDGLPIQQTLSGYFMPTSETPFHAVSLANIYSLYADRLWLAFITLRGIIVIDSTYPSRSDKRMVNWWSQQPGVQPTEEKLIPIIVFDSTYSPRSDNEMVNWWSQQPGVQPTEDILIPLTLLTHLDLITRWWTGDHSSPVYSPQRKYWYLWLYLLI